MLLGKNSFAFGNKLAYIMWALSWVVCLCFKLGYHSESIAVTVLLLVPFEWVVRDSIWVSYHFSPVYASCSGRGGQVCGLTRKEVLSQ